MKNFLAMAAVLICGMAGAEEKPSAAAATREAVMSSDDLKTLVKNLSAINRIKKEPKENDWLAKYKEPGQSFAEFLEYRPKQQVKPDNTLYVQPLGEFDADQKKLVADTVEFLGLFYAVKVKTLETLPLTVIPDEARRTHPKWGDKQIKTGYVQGLLKKNAKRDAFATLALTTSDLYPDDNWNFVFGEASLIDRVGVWSLYRYGDPKKQYDMVLRRTLKVATHETGHMLGIYHCTAYECGMNGSNHLDEADAQPMWFCGECDAKVIFACGAEAKKRYEALAAFATAHGFKEEAAYWAKAAKMTGK